MKKNWAIPIVVLIAVLDIVLVFLAIRHTSGPSASAQETDQVSTEQTGDESTGTTGETTTEQTTSSGSTTSQAAASGGISLVSLASDGTAIRSTSQPCAAGAQAVVEVSTDGGATFKPVNVSNEHQVLRVVASSAANLQYVGAGQDCQPSLYQSVDGGATWSKGPADGSWHLSPGPASSTVEAPTGSVDAGCAAVSISVLSKSAAVVSCADGSARTTSNGGETWSPAGEPQGIVSVSFLNATAGYALAVGENCPAEIRRTTDGGQTWNPVGCIPSGEPMAIDAIGQQAVAIVGGSPHVTTDGGSTWT